MKADATHEMTQALSDFERGLLKVLERIEIRGKKRHTVPVLLTEQMNHWLGVLLTNRPQYVPEASPYLFACAAEYSYFRGSDALRQPTVKIS